MKSAIYSVSNFATKLTLYPIGFIASIWISRYLGAEDKGVYAYIVILTSFFIPIFSLGIGGGLIYFISNKEYEINQVWLTTILLGLFVGLFNTMLLICLWNFNLLGESAGQFDFYHIAIVGMILVFNSVYFFLTRIGFGGSVFHSLNLFEILKSIMNPVFMILLVYVLALRIDGVLYSLLIMNVVLALGFATRLYLKFKPQMSFSFDFIKKSFIYGLKGWFGDMAVRANVRLDQLILGGIVSAKSLGIYSVGVTLSELLWIIPDSIGPVLFNRIAAEKDIQIKTRLTERIHRILFILSAIISIFWVLTCFYIIIPFGYGAEFSGSLLPMMILVPGALLYIPAKMTTKLLSGTGRILDTSKATVAGSAISILLYFILIPKFEIIGAAIASTIGYLFVSIFCTYFANLRYGLKVFNLFIPNTSDYYWMKDQILALKNRK